MKAEFTEIEKIILKGQSAALARKHRCSNMYVLYILKGEREINTELAKKIYKELKHLAKFLTPQTPKK
jgi:hypothetical protein